MSEEEGVARPEAVPETVVDADANAAEEAHEAVAVSSSPVEDTGADASDRPTIIVEVTPAELSSRVEQPNEDESAPSAPRMTGGGDAEAQEDRPVVVESEAVGVAPPDADVPSVQVGSSTNGGLKKSTRKQADGLRSQTSGRGGGGGMRSSRKPAKGRTAITEANEAGLAEAMHPGWSQGGFVGMSTGLHLNGEQLTTAEENMRFRQRCKARPTYRGPVYVAEDLHVPCQSCGGPVDPIKRVPVGKLFYHPDCIRCYLCGRSGVTEPFQQVGSHQVICSFCASKGHAPCVRKEEAAHRGVVLGAIRGNPDKLLLACHEEERVAMRPQTVNQATLAGAVAPTLTIGPVHTRRNTTARSFGLMQRQQYYTQNDRNILATLPATARAGTTASTQRDRLLADDASGLAAIRARRRSGSTVETGNFPQLMYNES